MKDNNRGREECEGGVIVDGVTRDDGRKGGDSCDHGVKNPRKIDCLCKQVGDKNHGCSWQM